MIRVTVLYPKTPGAHFDHAYYAERHMPESIRRLGQAMTSVTVERGVSAGAPWPDPTFEAAASYTCESAEAYAAAFMPHADWLQGDIPNYTDITPIIQISEIVLAQALP